jgi:hypothetical protein
MSFSPSKKIMTRIFNHQSQIMGIRESHSRLNILLRQSFDHILWVITKLTTPIFTVNRWASKASEP